MNKKVEKNKMRIGFDNEKYLKMQSEHIRNRIGKFGNKLYLEFGGKLFDDYHASRVLPGFAPDSKLRLLKELSSQAEIVIVISAKDIEKNKIRGDLGITYDTDVLRLIQTYKDQGLYVGSVTITQFSGQESALLFKNRLEKLHIPVYLHYLIPGYPSNIPLIISDEGYGKNDYIKTSRPLVIVTAPGPGSGKMAACLSQLYHEHKRGVLAGYAKFETFPIWNLPLKHPVNLAYEAATADLNDINMIDPFHLEAYGETTVNYNRDVEIFPVLNTIFEKIYGESPYKSPTDMGVNMAGNCICDDEACREASKQEIIRRYFDALNALAKGSTSEKEAQKIELLMNMAGSAVYVGPIGSGNVAKLANQIIVAVNIAAVSEALTLATKAGTDPELVYQAIRGGLAGSTVLDAKAPMMMDRNFKPGFRIELHMKDLNNALNAGHAVNAALPLTAELMEIMQSLKADGCEKEDHSSIVKYYEKISNVFVERERK